MPGLIVAVAGDTTDVKGVPGVLVAPPGVFVSVTPTVLAMGKPVLTLGATVPTHGNPKVSTAPGYNPKCACAKVALKTIPTILVEGKPLAVIGVGTGSVASCGHYVLGPGAPTVMVNTGG